MLILIQAISVLGSELTRFALPLWIYQKTNSNTYLSILFIAELLPRTLLGPFVGVLSDRFHPKFVCFGGQILQACEVNPLALFAASFLLGVGGSIQFPAFQKIVSRLPGPLNRNVAYLNGLENLAMFAAPRAAGPRVPRAHGSHDHGLRKIRAEAHRLFRTHTSHTLHGADSGRASATRNYFLRCSTFTRFSSATWDSLDHLADSALYSVRFCNHLSRSFIATCSFESSSF